MTIVRPTFTRQSFFEVARRRMSEAQILLDVPHRYCDGAVVISLLACECALKATLLHGHQLDRPEDLPESIRKPIFQSKTGHLIPILWQHQTSRVLAVSTPALASALQRLAFCDRYVYRYGVKRPLKNDAQPLIDSAQDVVNWMMGVVV